LELAHREHFTVPDWLERQKYIGMIRRDEDAFLRVLQALMEIKNKNLYRPYVNMNDFCRSIFGWSERRTQQLLKAGKTVLALPGGKRTLVRNEGQARELAKAGDHQEQVLDEVVRTGEPTAKLIKQKVDNIRTTLFEGPEDLHGNPITGPAVEYWNRRNEIQQAMDHASALKVFFEKIEERDRLYHRLWPVGRMHDNAADIFSAFQGILPSYLCGYCDGTTLKDGKTCEGCNGTGLLSVYHEKRLPPEKKHVRT
jgi:hypothetical protein